MSDSPLRVLSVVEAARRIYNTPQPSDEQVGRVAEKIRSGVLQRSQRGGWTTTIGAVADYLAHQEATKATSRHKLHGYAGTPALHSPSDAASDPYASVSGLYQSLLKDYFLAVLLRRKPARRSTSFHRVVWASQACLLGLLLFGMATLAAFAVKTTWVPPEHRIVESWLREHFEDVRVERIRSDADSMDFRADFNYRSGSRRVHSHLQITLRGNRVVDASSAD